MMRPQRWRRMWAAAAFVQAKAPLRWTAMTASQSSSFMLMIHAVAEDAGVVDEDVDAAPGVERRR